MNLYGLVCRNESLPVVQTIRVTKYHGDGLFQNRWIGYHVHRSRYNLAHGPQLFRRTRACRTTVQSRANSMSSHTSREPGDAALGMKAPITRRDFLGSTLLA